MAKPPKFRLDGEPDERGHGEGSKGTRFGADDGRPRPGRRKGARSERSEIEEIKKMMVEVTIGKGENQRKRRVSTRTAYTLRQREKALAGDQKAIEWLDRKFGQYEPPDVDLHQTAALIAEDKAILADAFARGLRPAPPLALPAPRVEATEPAEPEAPPPPAEGDER